MPYLSRSDMRINYQLAGSPPADDNTPVAMIHGLGANLAFWYLGAVRHLGKDRTLIMHDLRGHGSSSMPQGGYGLEYLAEDLAFLLDDIGAEKAHIVGHSHGARVALAFAMEHPERVASLTIADTQLRALQKPMRLADWAYWPRWKADLAAQGVTSFPPENAEIDFRLLAELGPRGGGALKGDRPGRNAIQKCGTSDAAGLVRTGELITAASTAPRGINLKSRQMGQRGSRQWQKLLDTTSADVELHDESCVDPKRLKELTMPSLLMYGEMSHCLPTSERLMEIMPSARRVVVPGAGHFFPIAKPRFFARALRMFLAGVDTPGGAPSFERKRIAARIASARMARKEHPQAPAYRSGDA